ncbi:glycosyltransferase family 4 protein [Naasia lichenicola]|uniref:Glycosyltransferase family 4 protein n=1 Tax=Naasia lichenicola TaxID=2565933 RepID=A0A4V3WT01_9MICO|nr:glycosyltransferase family 4 protein [Naasia lichenicola]THG29907.1 glycosyltransferase family 4 protein [Naasia lichenicola]
MSDPSRRPPAQLIVGPPEHGVVGYARSLASALHAAQHPEAPADGERVDRAHLHFTDRLFGPDPERAAARIGELAQQRSLSVTLHDIPQPSDGETSLIRRAAAYRSVIRAARGVVCNSEHEAELIRRHVDADAVLEVIPLPVESPFEGSTGGATAAPTASSEPTVAIVGFIYPGKGHREAIDALADARERHGSDGLPRTVTAFGRASAGHERDVDALRAHAERRGVGFETTGYLTDDELMARCVAAAVPLSAHQHISASGSINTWLRAGRRPLVLSGRYAREMEALRPGSLRLVDSHDLPDAIADSARRPPLTRLASTVSLRPLLADTVEAYVAWWRSVSW